MTEHLSYTGMAQAFCGRWRITDSTKLAVAVARGRANAEETNQNNR